MTRLGFVAAILLMAPLRLGAGEDPADSAKLAFFESKIRPVLVEHCYECHSAKAKNIRGGLLLDTRAGSRQGGESGAAVVPGNMDESLLLSALRHESFEMPPDRKLPPTIVADFQAWIASGAFDPRDGEVRSKTRTIDIEAGREFWSFRPVAQSSQPTVQNKAWPRSQVDQFILHRLESAGLAPVADAQRQTLLRRAYFALIGLPPTPAQIDEFLSDDSPTAFERVVDELLRSPRFGERWGRHWLDAVRFAESSGGGRTLMFPDAWRYRDYVIEAFNKDLPYDQFIRQQVAGDLLEASDWQEQRRNITATAFLLLGPTNYELQDKEVLEMDIVDEQLDTLGKAFLGMTIGCARCHDHKFDPIPTHDYYALAGIFKSTQSVIHSNVSKWNECELPISPAEEAIFAEHEAKVAVLQAKLKSLQAELKQAGGVLAVDGKSIAPQSLPGIVVDDRQAKTVGKWTTSQSVGGYIGDRYIHSMEAGASVTFAPKLPRRARYELRIAYTPSSNRSRKVPIRIHHAQGESVAHVNQTKSGSISASIDSLGVFEFDPAFSPRVVVSPDGAASGVVIADAVIFVPEDAATKDVDPRAQLTAEIESLAGEIKKLQAKGPKRPLAMAAVDLEVAADVPIAIRGVVHNSGPIVPRGVLQVTLDGEMPSVGSGQSGRLQVSDWIASADNPLTARVMANRVWYWLFGKGLVRTVDNFGATGEMPSHPELLDYLATQFIEDGWSVKRLIRRLMLSRTYQLAASNQQSAGSDQPSSDPNNRLLSRMNRQRLDAESIRDSLLLIGGQLDLTMGGSNIAAGTKSEYGYEFKSTRRSVYVPVFRNALPQIFATFDFADPNTQAGMRTTSTTSPQALLLMNHPLVMKQSQAAARRLLALPELSMDERIARAYRQVVGRAPSERESQLAADFLGDSQEPQRWGQLYQALFQSLDFRFLK